MNRLRVNIDRELIFLLMLSVFAVAPLFSPGYFFDAHDAGHSVFFLVEFDSAIRDGALWPRWGPDHALGFGYPLWLLYAPLAYFVAEFFHLLGLGFTAAVKVTWALAFVAGGWGMYLLSRRWWGDTSLGRAAALVAALIYVYAPYHLLTISVRAAFAEFCAMAWFPWVLLAFDDLIERGGTRRVALAALALAGLMLTHTASILIFTPLLMAYVGFAVVRRSYRSAIGSHERHDPGVAQTSGMAATPETQPPQHAGWTSLWQSSLSALVAGLLAVGLAAIFLLPMLLERQYIVQSQWVQGTYSYRQHFVFFNQFLDPFWGFGYSDDPLGIGDGMGFQLGIIGAGLALAGLVAGLRREAIGRSTTAFFALATLVLLVLMMPVAQPVWDSVSPLALIQFPWRLLGLVSLTVAVLAGGAVVNLLRLANSPSPFNLDTPAAYVMALVVVLSSFPYTAPQYTDIRPENESALSIINFETQHPDMIGITVYADAAPTDTPLVGQYRSGQPLEKVVILNGTGQLRGQRVGGASVSVDVEATEPLTLQFLTYDFPGWAATIDGERVSHGNAAPYGLITVDLPAGQHMVEIRHGTTPVRTLGAIISLLSLVFILFLLLWDRPKPSDCQK
ncbi:MAG: 6-pyruvoyl-tetrahydropterin synthase-related protein [Chloroflexota bacterium]|nr:6-pyruvoyl-tetrahydropterin synthase-related protein [Chloroflexota bacterium]